MLYLIAQGPKPAHSWQHPIPENEVLRLGRRHENDFPTPWDVRISRRHARLSLRNGHAEISCLDEARNPIVFQGNSCQRVRVAVGEEFRIGRTMFRLVEDDPDSVIRKLIEEEIDEGGSADDTQYGLSTSDRRLALISQYSQSLWLSASEKELAAGLVGLLGEVIPHAESIAVLKCEDPASKDCKPQILHWDGRRRNERIPLSRPLISAALTKSQTIVRVRRDEIGTDDGFDRGRWVICAPIPSGQNAGSWCLYIWGQYGPNRDLPSGLSPDDLSGDVQVTELLAQLSGAIRQIRTLEDRFAGIRQFFSPAVVESVASEDSSSALAPTENETAVLFCDLQGYSKIADASRSNLQKLLDRVNGALDVMTRSIIQEDGVIADFQGDSALGFWGWPLELDEGPLPACRAALSILQRFQRANSGQVSSSLQGFRVGIGIACGPAIAGRIGTQQQAKVGVFGPVVNLGSRLEGMTRQIGVPILIDSATRDAVREKMSDKEARCRKIGVFRPAGVSTPVEVSELLPPERHSHISNEDVGNFEEAVEAFIDGDWDDALDLLAKLPAKDRARDFLLMQIAQHNYEPPEDWDGIINLTEK